MSTGGKLTERKKINENHLPLSLLEQSQVENRHHKKPEKKWQARREREH